MTDFETNFFEQATQITKAHGYDILVEQVGELKAEIERLKGLIKDEFMYFNRGVIQSLREKLWQQFKTENKL